MVFPNVRLPTLYIFASSNLRQTVGASGGKDLPGADSQPCELEPANPGSSIVAINSLYIGPYLRTQIRWPIQVIN